MSLEPCLSKHDGIVSSDIEPDVGLSEEWHAVPLDDSVSTLEIVQRSQDLQQSKIGDCFLCRLTKARSGKRKAKLNEYFFGTYVEPSNSGCVIRFLTEPMTCASSLNFFHCPEKDDVAYVIHDDLIMIPVPSVSQDGRSLG